MRETSMHYERPYRPTIIRLANTFGRLLARAGVRADLTPRSLLAAAERRNRLDDFGEPPVEEPLGRLVDAIEREAELHPVGRMITRERLIGVLGNRLRLRHFQRTEPGVFDRPAAPPVVIVGLQRTGTTFLHRLLAADPKTRSVASWEALNPAPFLDPRRPDRLALALRAERALSYLAPDFFAVHPVKAHAPEEDSILLDFSLLSPVAEATLRVPGYAAWLAGCDMTPAYRTLKAMLKLLEWQRPASRWVLKSPAHLPFLDVLLRVFPDARVVHTHRDPEVTVASYCSMIAHGRGVFSDRVDAMELGSELLAKQSDMLLAGVRLRRKHGVDGAILDVEYDDLIADPAATVARIYVHAGWRLDHQDAVIEASRVHTQNRHGRHRYSLASFGLDPDTVRCAFALYLESRRRRARAHA